MCLIHTIHVVQADQSSGYEVAQHFQRKINKRLLPDYFDVIKEPMAFSTIRVSGSTCEIL
jgi:chromatin structure-remodeling complex subunit RSC1/2